MANSTRSVLRSLTNWEVKIDKFYKLWSENEYNTAVDEAIFHVNQLGGWKWETREKTVTGTTTASQQFYDRPTDFRSLSVIEFNDKELTEIQYEDLQRKYTTLPTWTPTNYYHYQGKIWLHPIPTTAGTLKILYRTEVTKLATDATESPFVYQFDRAIALYAAYILLSQPSDNKNLQRAQTKLARFKEEFTKLYKMFFLIDRENLSFKSTYIPKSQLRWVSRSRFSYLWDN